MVSPRNEFPSPRIRHQSLYGSGPIEDFDPYEDSVDHPGYRDYYYDRITRALNRNAGTPLPDSATKQRDPDDPVPMFDESDARDLVQETAATAIAEIEEATGIVLSDEELFGIFNHVLQNVHSPDLPRTARTFQSSYSATVAGSQSGHLPYVDEAISNTVDTGYRLPFTPTQTLQLRAIYDQLERDGHITEADRRALGTDPTTAAATSFATTIQASVLENLPEILFQAGAPSYGTGINKLERAVRPIAMDNPGLFGLGITAEQRASAYRLQERQAFIDDPVANLKEGLPTANQLKSEARRQFPGLSKAELDALALVRANFVDNASDALQEIISNLGYAGEGPDSPRYFDTIQEFIGAQNELLVEVIDQHHLTREQGRLSNYDDAVDAVDTWLKERGIDSDSVTQDYKDELLGRLFDEQEAALSDNRMPRSPDELFTEIARVDHPHLGTQEFNITPDIIEAAQEMQARPSIQNLSDAVKQIEDWFVSQDTTSDTIDPSRIDYLAQQLVDHYRGSAEEGSIPYTVDEFLGPIADQIPGLQQQYANRQAFFPDVSIPRGTAVAGTPDISGISEYIEQSLARLGIGEVDPIERSIRGTEAFQEHLRNEVIPRLMSFVRQEVAQRDRFTLGGQALAMNDADLDAFISQFLNLQTIPPQIRQEFPADPRVAVSREGIGSPSAGITAEMLSPDLFGMPPSPAGLEFGEVAPSPYRDAPPALTPEAMARADIQAMRRGPREGRQRAAELLEQEQEYQRIAGEFASEDPELQAYLLQQLPGLKDSPEFAEFTQVERAKQLEHLNKLMDVLVKGGQIHESLAKTATGLEKSLGYDKPPEFSTYAQSQLPVMAEEFMQAPVPSPFRQGEFQTRQAMRTEFGEMEAEQVSSEAERKRRKKLKGDRTVFV